MRDAPKCYYDMRVVHEFKMSFDCQLDYIYCEAVGKLLVERYRDILQRRQRWTQFSVANVYIQEFGVAFIRSRAWRHRYRHMHCGVAYSDIATRTDSLNPRFSGCKKFGRSIASAIGNGHPQ